MTKWIILFVIAVYMIYIFPLQVYGQAGTTPECPSGFEYDSENQTCHLDTLITCAEGSDYNSNFGACTSNNIFFLDEEIDNADYYLDQGDPTGSIATSLDFLRSITMCKNSYDLENGAYRAQNCVVGLYSNDTTELLEKENRLCENFGWINEQGNCVYKLCEDGELDSKTCFKSFIPQFCNGWGVTKLEKFGRFIGYSCIWPQGYSDGQIHGYTPSWFFEELYEKGACPEETKLNIFGHCEAPYSPVCPTGTKLNAFGNCQATPTCSSGKLNVFGDCEASIKITCPSGSEKVLGVCEKKADCDNKVAGICTKYSCDSGWTKVGPLCTKSPSKTCPSGMHIKGLVCVKAPSCPEDTSLNDLNFCIGTLDKVCPEGTSLNKIGVCIGLPTCPFGYNLVNENSINTKCRLMDRPPQKPNCPAGTTPNEETLRCEWKASCSDGYIQQGDLCVSVTNHCPSGTSFNKTTNRCETEPSCPVGLVAFKNDCVDATTASLESTDSSKNTTNKQTQELPVLKKAVPEWIKDQSEWWLSGAISDREFIQLFEYLIENKIIDVPDLPHSDKADEAPIPSWFKNNVRWWINDQVSDYEFAKGLEYLVKIGVIVIQKN